MVVTLSEPMSSVRFRNSDAAAFEIAVGPHLAAMERLAMRLAPGQQADDVVQNALLRAWRRRSSYDPDRGTLANWLFAITANEAKRLTRRLEVGRFLRPFAQVMPIDALLDVEAAIKTLPPRQRLAIDCHYFAGLTVDETAAVMGCAPGTVKSTLSDARRQLKQRLEVK
jgi:RNA polymerase sigma-70 factor (ECF subfamily)